MILQGLTGQFTVTLGLLQFVRPFAALLCAWTHGSTIGIKESRAGGCGKSCEATREQDRVVMKNPAMKRATVLNRVVRPSSARFDSGGVAGVVGKLQLAIPGSAVHWRRRPRIRVEHHNASRFATHARNDGRELKAIVSNV